MPDTTTNLGLPYPLLTDTPNGAEQIQDLAEALDTLVKNAQPVTYEARATSTTGLTTVMTDVIGASATITTTVPNAIVVVTAVFHFTNSTAGTGTFTGALNSNGSDLNGIAAMTTRVTGNSGTVSQVWRVTYASPGSRIIKLRASFNGTAPLSPNVQASNTAFVATVYNVI